jgi:iron complex outermembrane receptor protein
LHNDRSLGAFFSLTAPRTASLLAVLALWATGPARGLAQEPRDTVQRDTVPFDTIYNMEPIKVRVARPVATAGGAAAVTTPLDSLRTIPAPTLADVLRQLPLIQIRENSRGEAQPAIRGMGSRRVAVLVDGVPITLGWDNRTDLSVVPVTAAREITLVRGLSSVLYGPNALGGAVLVAVGEANGNVPPPSPFQFNVGVDNLGNAAAALGLSTIIPTSSGEVTLRGGGGYRNRSAWPLPADVPPADPQLSENRLNSDMEHGNAFVSARYEAESGRWLSLTSFGFKAERGVPPERHTVDPRLWRYPDQWRWVTALSAGTGWRQTPWGEGDLEASVGLDFGETFIDTYSDIAYDSVTGGESGDDRTLSIRMLGDHTLGIGILRGALTAAETRHVEVIDDANPETYKQWLFSLGLEVDQPLLPDLDASRARVSVGVSVDGAGTPVTGPADPRDPIWTWGARAGGTVAIGDGSVVLNGGLSRRVRFPALRELYSGALGRFVVNPELDPEVLGVAELGATYRVGRFGGQAVAFYQRLTDAIVRVSVGDGKLQRQNRDKITSLGLELLIDALFGPLTVAADATIQNVTLTDPSAPDDQRNPEYQPWFNGGIFGTLRLPRGFWTTASVRHQAPRYCVHPDFDSEVKLASNTWFDLELGKSFGLGGSGRRRLDAVVAFDNLSDSSVFDQCGLPRPGRLVRFQMQIF